MSAHQAHLYGADFVEAISRQRAELGRAPSVAELSGLLERLFESRASTMQAVLQQSAERRPDRIAEIAEIAWRIHDGFFEAASFRQELAVFGRMTRFLRGHRGITDVTPANSSI